MSNPPILYRRRIIPPECVLLKDDIVLYYDENKIITKWNALHPKPGLHHVHHGFSCYFLRDGFKISKFYRADNTLLYHYCDIITSEYDTAKNELTVTDLLADVVVYPDSFIKVIDLDEFVTALEAGTLTLPNLKQALLSLDKLLLLIYAGKLDTLTADIERFQVLDDSSK